MIEVLGYIGAFCVGLILGLFGGGGSILAIPIMVYLFGINPTLASSYSLCIVGITASFGAIQKSLKGFINIKVGLWFGIPCLLASYITRLWVMPMLPDVLLRINNFTLTRDIFIMILFSLIIAYAAYSMIKGRTRLKNVEKVYHTTQRVSVIFLGAIIGFLTTLVGSGGGALIIPCLVLLLGMNMKVAVGTSLLIICAKSLIGFVGDLQNDVELDWSFLIMFIGLAILGIIIGNTLSSRIDSSRLKKLFGWIILFLAVFILLKEIF